MQRMETGPGLGTQGVEGISQLGGESRANVIVVPGSWLVGCSFKANANIGVEA